MWILTAKIKVLLWSTDINNYRAHFFPMNYYLTVVGMFACLSDL